MYFLWSLEQIEEFGMFWPNRLFDQTVLAKPFVTANRGWPLILLLLLLVFYFT